MAITYRASATVKGNSLDPVVIDKPTGTIDGDLMLAFITLRNTSELTITPPSGWTQIDNQFSSGAHLATYWKIAATEGANYSFDLSGAATRAIGSIISLISAQGFPSNPVDVHSTAAGLDANPTATGVTSTVDNNMLVFSATLKANTSLPAPTGMTIRFDEGQTAVRQAVCDVSKIAPGATGNKTSAGSTSTNWVAQLVAVKCNADPAAATHWNRGALNFGFEYPLPYCLNRIICFGVSGSYLYAGGRDKTGVPHIIRTSDGLAWTACTVTFNATETDVYRLYGAADGYIYAATRDSTNAPRILRSADGVTWAEVATLDATVRYGRWFAEFGGYIYLGVVGDSGVGARLYRSSDGTAWAQSYQFADTTINRIQSLLVVGSNLYALTDQAGVSGSGFLFVSTNGTSFTKVNSNQTDGAAGDLVHSLVAFGGNYYIGEQDTANGAKVWKSTDLATWTKVWTSPLTTNEPEAYNLYVAGGKLYLACRSLEGYPGRVYSSSDGMTWVQEWSDGFGDSNYYGGFAFIEWDSKLFTCQRSLEDATNYPSIPVWNMFADVIITLYPSSIVSQESFGTPKLTLKVLPAAINSAESFGTPKLTLKVLPAAINSAESFGTPKLTLKVLPAAINSAESFGTPKLTLKVLPAAINSAESFGTPKLTLKVLPAAINSAESFGTPKLTLKVLPAAINSAESFGTPKLTLEEAEADASSAWALDAEDDTDTYQSYAVDSIGRFGEAYIESVLFAGELRIPAQDILDGGSLSLSAPNDFSSLISADHTMRLLNRNNQYSSRHANFIFAGENDWQRKNIKIEMGFTTPEGIETGTILLYVGNILKWGPVPLSISPDSYESGEVEIYSRDAISLFMDQQIGTPDDAGTPDPVVCGQILREATKLGDNSLDTPVKDIDYEGNILDELSTVDLSGAGNLIELSSTDSYDSLKCLRAYALVPGWGRGWIDLPSTSDNVLFKTKIKFVSIPSPPIAYNMAFLRVKAGGSDLILLEVNSDYRVYLNYNGTRKETDWYVNRNQDIWMDLSIGIYGKNPGLIRVSLDGNQIINYDKESDTPLNLTTLAVIQKIGLGISIAATETWEILFANSKLYNIYYPEAYYVPGYPFINIGSVYVDGVVKVEKTKNGIVQTYSGGKAVDPVDLTKIPAQGLVVFGDLANPPSGSVFLMMDKDANIHPVDAIEAVLIAGGRDDLIDAASFAAAKAARPNDSVGCYFENMSMADAVLAISQRALLNVIIAQGKVKILPYDGTAPVTYDWMINQSVCAGLSASDDSEAKKNKVNAKWGQYDTNSRLFYAAQDAVSIAKLGPFEEELDFSWGGEVGSDNGDMARNRADCLLNRLKGSLVLYENLMALAWKFIRAEIGDTPQVNIPYFGPAEIFKVVGKDVTMTPPYELTLSLALYPGES